MPTNTIIIIIMLLNYYHNLFRETYIHRVLYHIKMRLLAHQCSRYNRHWYIQPGQALRLPNQQRNGRMQVHKKSIALQSEDRQPQARIGNRDLHPTYF